MGHQGTASEVHHRQAALELLTPLLQRQAAEDGALTDPRQADEGMAGETVKAAGEARQLGHHLGPATGGVKAEQLATAGIQQVQRPAVEPR